MKFTLSTADCTGNAANCLYPQDQEVSTPEELAAAIMKDQVFARYKGGYRSITNFLESNVIPMDCDNDYSDNPEDWLTAEKLEEIFADVDHVIFPSRHHMRPKPARRRAQSTTFFLHRALHGRSYVCGGQGRIAGEIRLFR